MSSIKPEGYRPIERPAYEGIKGPEVGKAQGKFYTKIVNAVNELKKDINRIVNQMKGYGRKTDTELGVGTLKEISAKGLAGNREVNAQLKAVQEKVNFALGYVSKGGLDQQGVEELKVWSVEVEKDAQKLKDYLKHKDFAKIMKNFREIRNGLIAVPQIKTASVRRQDEQVAKLTAGENLDHLLKVAKRPKAASQSVSGAYVKAEPKKEGAVASISDKIGADKAGSKLAAGVTGLVNKPDLRNKIAAEALKREKEGVERSVPTDRAEKGRAVEVRNLKLEIGKELDNYINKVLQDDSFRKPKILSVTQREILDGYARNARKIDDQTPIKNVLRMPDGATSLIKKIYENKSKNIIVPEHSKLDKLREALTEFTIEGKRPVVQGHKPSGKTEWAPEPGVKKINRGEKSPKTSESEIRGLASKARLKEELVSLGGIESSEPTAKSQEVRAKVRADQPERAHLRKNLIKGLSNKFNDFVEAHIAYLGGKNNPTKGTLYIEKFKRQILGELEKSSGKKFDKEKFVNLLENMSDLIDQNLKHANVQSYRLENDKEGISKLFDQLEGIG